MPPAADPSAGGFEAALARTILMDQATSGSRAHWGASPPQHTRLPWGGAADPPVLAGFRRLRTVPFAPLNQRSAVSKLDPFCSRASTGFPSVSCDGVAARTERILSACSAASMARWRMPSGHGRRFGTSAVSDRRPIFGWRPRQALGLTACNPEGVPTTPPALPC